jgi:phage shock protein A
MSNDSIFSQVLRGLLGARLYRLLKVLVFGKLNENLDNASPMGREEAEEALRENKSNIAKIMEAIAAAQSRSEQLSTILGTYQGQHQTYEKHLEKVITEGRPQDEVEDAAAQVVELETFITETGHSMAQAQGVLSEAKRALSAAQREQIRLERQKQLADLRGQLASALEEVRGQQDSGPLEIVQRYTQGAERRLGTAVAVEQLAQNAPGKNLAQIERGLSATEAIARAKQRLGLPSSGSQPLQLEPSNGVRVTENR